MNAKYKHFARFHLNWLVFNEVAIQILEYCEPVLKVINNLNISLKRTSTLIFLTILETSKEIPRNEIISKEYGHKNVVLGNAFYTYLKEISSFLSYKFF